MQFIHISDTHLGRRRFGFIEAEKDHYDALNEIVDFAIKEHVSCVVHSGDIFDAPKPSGNALHHLVDGLIRLNESGIDFLFVMGEHDKSRLREKPVPLLITKLGLGKHLTLDNLVEVEGVKFLGRDKKREWSPDERKKLRDAKVDGKSVLALHQGLSEFHQYAGELSIGDLPVGYSYYALGHLHSYMIKRSSLGAPLVYPGAPVPVKEWADHNKRTLVGGFVFVDMSSSEPRFERIQLKHPRKYLFYECETLKDFDEVIKDIEGYEKKPVVSLVIKNIDEEKCRASLAKIRSLSLYTNWETISGVSGTAAVTKRPENLEEELLRLGEKILEDRELTIMALREIPEVMESDGEDGVAKMIWDRVVE